MDANEYQKLALRTESTPKIVAFYPDGTQVELNARLLHGALGCASEIGEALDPIKKNIMYRKPMDRTNIIEECGDRLWYIAIELDAVGATMSDAMERNIAKLKARYGDKYSDQAALNRDLTAERKILENEKEDPVPSDMWGRAFDGEFGG